MERQKVADFIRQEGLFTSEAHVLIGLSGGADSVALLRLLLDAGYRCTAAHCNFHLRGEESDRDENFVRDLCRQWKVQLRTVHFHTAEEAARRHISIEMAARHLRYEWFEQLRQEIHADVIAVAHHRDDSVETFLLNLIRGTGLNGLRGIRPRNGHVVRPLLCLNRSEITDYLDRIGQPYVTDSTNLQDEYTRNKIRLRLLPMMQEINPSIKETLTDTAHRLDEAYKVYRRGVDEARQRVTVPGQGIHIPTLLQEASPAATLFEVLHPLGFNATQIDNILQTIGGQSGKRFEAPDWLVVKDRDTLLIRPRQEEAQPPTLQQEERTYSPGDPLPRDKQTACFDADKLKSPLSLRRWKAGDSFVPFGMKGRKKVSDYLTDRKFSLLDKEQQWVLCCGTDIIWLVGERPDNRYRVDDHTRRILLVRVL